MALGEATQSTVAAGADVTFRGNREMGRHGWLRLTPAYSVRLVERLIDGLGAEDRVLDPFAGSGTTLLACGERGISCTGVEINPFLVWFAGAKTATYGGEDREAATVAAGAILAGDDGGEPWRPPMRHIERWWDGVTVRELGRVRAGIDGAAIGAGGRDLLRVAFCRAVIATSRASYRHQSVSLRHDISQGVKGSVRGVGEIFESAVAAIVATAGGTVGPSPVVQGDARSVDAVLAGRAPGNGFSAVITSPPYANRMSYVRELRPYMYWLGCLQSGAEAGELDWRAIGGTWGRATSRLATWQPAGPLPLADPRYRAAVDAIGARSPLLGRYVERYIHDAAAHVASLRPLLAPGARIAYVVGNSRFFDVMVDTERIYADLFAAAGFRAIAIEELRRRTSKRELREFLVTAIA